MEKVVDGVKEMIGKKKMKKKRPAISVCLCVPYPHRQFWADFFIGEGVSPQFM
jgi:hypothetical protein